MSINNNNVKFEMKIYQNFPKPYKTILTGNLHVCSDNKCQ